MVIREGNNFSSTQVRSKGVDSETAPTEKRNALREKSPIQNLSRFTKENLKVTNNNYPKAMKDRISTLWL